MNKLKRLAAWINGRKKILLPALLVAALFVAGRLLDMNAYLQAIQKWMWQFGSWGPIVFVGIVRRRDAGAAAGNALYRAGGLFVRQSVGVRDHDGRDHAGGHPGLRDGTLSGPRQGRAPSGAPANPRAAQGNGRRKQLVCDSLHPPHADLPLRRQQLRLRPDEHLLHSLHPVVTDGFHSHERRHGAGGQQPLRRLDRRRHILADHGRRRGQRGPDPGHRLCRQAHVRHEIPSPEHK